MGSRAGRAGKKSEEDWINDNIVMCGLGLPLEVTISFLFSDGPSPDRRRYPLIAQSINVFPTTRSENMEWA